MNKTLYVYPLYWKYRYLVSIPLRHCEHSLVYTIDYQKSYDILILQVMLISSLSHRLLSVDSFSISYFQVLDLSLEVSKISMSTKSFFEAKIDNHVDNILAKEIKFHISSFSSFLDTCCSFYFCVSKVKAYHDILFIIWKARNVYKHFSN